MSKLVYEPFRLVVERNRNAALLTVFVSGPIRFETELKQVFVDHGYLSPFVSHTLGGVSTVCCTVTVADYDVNVSLIRSLWLYSNVPLLNEGDRWEA